MSENDIKKNKSNNIDSQEDNTDSMKNVMSAPPLIKCEFSSKQKEVNPKNKNKK